MSSGISYTVWRCLRRLKVLSKTFSTTARSAITFTVHGPSIAVTPSVGMVDEKVHIHIRGLDERQQVTVVADVVENGMKFESRCVYQADDNGEIDNFYNESISGSFKGIEPMGLFWSLRCLSAPKQSARLVKKDVSAPMNYNITVYPDAHEEPTQPLCGAKVQRLYKKPGVKRIPLSGKYKGTIFIPEGEGPFPGLVDMYGGLVSLIETRAALLASHGYSTMALSYIHGEGLPEMLYDADFNYIKEAYEWFIEQNYVDKNRLGAVGLSFGGFMSLALASVLPQVRAVVNINGISITPEENIIISDSKDWHQKDEVFNTEEGIVFMNVYQCDNPWTLPAWQHGAKILIIVGEDDKQLDPKWHDHFCDSCPEQFKGNISVYRYPGAGHMIEPPYAPHTRVVTPGRKRMSTLDFIPEKYYDEDMMIGGWPDQHAHAQEDSWRQILKFLGENLKNGS